MNWLQSTLTDSEGRYDVAYVSLFGVGGTVMFSILTMCAGEVWAFAFCQPSEKLPVCTFGSQQLGFAIGAVCGGFATALGALAAYMAATRVVKKIPQP